MTPSPQEKEPQSAKEKWQTFRRTLPDAIELARPQAKLWLFGLGLLLVGRLAGLVAPMAPKVILDDAIPDRNLTLLYGMIGAVLVATLIQAAAAYALTQTISKAGQRVIADWRKRIHAHVTRLSLRYYDNRTTGEIVSRILNDIEGVRNLLGTGMVEFAGGLMTAVVVLGILFWLDWSITVVILAFLTIFAFVTAKAYAHLRPIYKERQKIRAEMNGRLTEGIGGVRVVKAFNAETSEHGAFGSRVDSYLMTILRTIHANSTVALASKFLLGLLAATVFLIGAHRILEGELEPGALFTYILYMGQLVGPIAAIVEVGTQLSEVFAGLERVKETLAQVPEDADEAERAPLPRLRGEVRVEDVSFEYEPGVPVLHGVSLEAAPGTVTALVGPSGSGKSTLMGLLGAFREPTSGRILVDGRDLALVKRGDFRSQLGAVLQETFLFSGTVRENIAYARPEAPLEDVREAARLANALDFVEGLPKGFDTVIGERGIKLSGGQRQRLAIARALLADPRILLLDEATSALDTESEEKIQEALATLMEGRTTFVIAHRLSTIRSATQILVMEEGRIVERGTHNELLARRGRYFDMYNRQHRVVEDLYINPGEERALTAEARA